MHSDEIAEEIRKGRKHMDALIGKAKSTLRALNVEIHDEQIERSSPITFAEQPLPEADENLVVQSGNERVG